MWTRKYREEDEQLSEEEQAALDAALPRYPLELSALFFCKSGVWQVFHFQVNPCQMGGGDKKRIKIFVFISRNT